MFSLDLMFHYHHSAVYKSLECQVCFEVLKAASSFSRMISRHSQAIWDALSLQHFLDRSGGLLLDAYIWNTSPERHVRRVSGVSYLTCFDADKQHHIYLCITEEPVMHNSFRKDGRLDIPVRNVCCWAAWNTTTLHTWIILDLWDKLSCVLLRGA